MSEWIPLEEAYPGLSVKTSRLGAGDQKRTTITAIRLESPEGISGPALRKVAQVIARAELAWNSPGRTVTANPATGKVSDSWATPPSARELRLPAVRDDAFYVKLAGLYQRLVFHGVQPASAIADVNGLRNSAVHALFREARRRGFLSPGRKGRAG
jgi:hypothetical protein